MILTLDPSKPESTISEILPLIAVFFGDETIEIRRKVLSTLAPVIETLGAEAAEQHVLPDVIRMAQDPQWRVRLSVVETLPIYAKHMGMDLFNQMRELTVHPHRVKPWATNRVHPEYAITASIMCYEPRPP